MLHLNFITFHTRVYLTFSGGSLYYLHYIIHFVYNQEVSSKLLESVSKIAGSGLEATTWLRRNLTVRIENAEKKEGSNGKTSLYSTHEQQNTYINTAQIEPHYILPHIRLILYTKHFTDASAYSVAALSVLAELLAPLLDVLYMSEEKERVVPLLTNIMAHVIPYLRNHS